jgi:hypothetical protein
MAAGLSRGRDDPAPRRIGTMHDRQSNKSFIFNILRLHAQEICCTRQDFPRKRRPALR